jgi:microcystin-dependent protein
VAATAPIEYDSGTSTISLNEASLFSKIYPVGSIYTNASVNTNPATLLGFGTWDAFGSGRVLVGVDAADTDFDTLGETGGAKTHTLTVDQMPSHTHTQDSHNHTQNAHTHKLNMAFGGVQQERFEWGTGTSAAVGTTKVATAAPEVDTRTTGGQRMLLDEDTRSTTATNNATTATNQNTGGGSAHNNLQPYITVYMWRRTA